MESLKIPQFRQNWSQKVTGPPLAHSKPAGPIFGTMHITMEGAFDIATSWARLRFDGSPHIGPVAVFICNTVFIYKNQCLFINTEGPVCHLNKNCYFGSYI